MGGRERQYRTSGHLEARIALHSRFRINALAITEVAPVLRYLASLILDVPFSESELRHVGAELESRLGRNRPFLVSKSTGVFVCQRA